MSKKNMLAMVMAIVAVVAVAGFAAHAQGKGAGNGDQTQARDGSCGDCPLYSDLDGDGVCDNAGTGSCDRDRARDGSNYSDADGDGVCDNRKLQCDGTQQRKRIGRR